MHQPVMRNEVVELLKIRPDGVYIDGTLGAGGHAEAVLERLGADGRLVGMDRDREALVRAAARLEKYGNRFVAVQGNFADMTAMAEKAGVHRADGIVLDLGMSSDQLDDARRGFSFLRDGPLDMRMDAAGPVTAADLVNSASEEELAECLRRLGEEPAARRIARRIVAARERRPIRSTVELAALVAEACGGRRGRIHPATRTFQALRMAVNRELESLERGLAAAFGLIAPGGRIAVLSFHSLEDRTVKQAFARHVGRRESLPAGGDRWVGELPLARWVTRTSLTPEPDEMARNPRARSARLRVVERVA